MFFKGCTMRCAWCHNPEAIGFEPEERFYPERCVGCGCCEEGCFSGARETVGREVSVEEIMREILADRHYYGAAGGVTLSGGECLAQPDGAYEVLRRCRAEGIGTVVESALHVSRRVVERCLPHIDLLLADIKLATDDEHRRWTGVGMDLILGNLALVATDGRVPVWARTPVIPGVNDSDDTIASIATIAARYPSVERYDLLPFNPLGTDKYASLGRDYRFADTAAPDAATMERLNRIADAAFAHTRTGVLR